MQDDEGVGRYMTGLIQGYAIGMQLSWGIHEAQKIVGKKRQCLGWGSCYGVRVSRNNFTGCRKRITVTCLLWHKWCAHVITHVSIHITVRGQISLLMVFSSMEIIRAHVKRTCREGWDWCHVWSHNWLLLGLGTGTTQWSKISMPGNPRREQVESSNIQNHSWHFMTSCRWLRGLIVSECFWPTSQFVQICVVCAGFTGWIKGRMAKHSWNQRQVKQGGFLSGHDFGNHPDVVQQRDVEGARRDKVKYGKMM